MEIVRSVTGPGLLASINHPPNDKVEPMDTVQPPGSLSQGGFNFFTTSHKGSIN
jgi:hypothetical protein